MNKKQLKDTAKKHVPKQNKWKHAIIAFISGGLFAFVGQILIMVYTKMLGMDEKSASTFMIVTVIFLTALSTGLGYFDVIAQKLGAGVFIPISGFANALTSCAMEGRSEGPIYGIGSNMFKLAGSVLTYGIVSACVFGALRFMFFGG